VELSDIFATSTSKKQAEEKMTYVNQQEPGDEVRTAQIIAGELSQQSVDTRATSTRSPVKKTLRCMQEVNGAACGRPAKVIKVVSSFHGTGRMMICDECRTEAGWDKDVDTLEWDDVAQFESESGVKVLRIRKPINDGILPTKQVGSHRVIPFIAPKQFEPTAPK
jgi:hypothetical protein